jgi:hypothetical protein
MYGTVHSGRVAWLLRRRTIRLSGGVYPIVVNHLDMEEARPLTLITKSAVSSEVASAKAPFPWI